MTELEKLQQMLGDRNTLFSEPFLTLLLEDVAEALANMGVDTTRCPALVRRIAVIRTNQFGSEGVASEGYSGVSQSFMADLPADIKREINAVRSVVWP